MKIRHFKYNAFIIEEGELAIAIDPGQNMYGFQKFSLIPEAEWMGVTHILVTHGDPDHFTYAVELAKESGAEVFCGEGLENDFISNGIMRPHVISPGEIYKGNGIKVEGLKVMHGPLQLKMLGGLMSVKAEVASADRGGTEVRLAGIRVQKIEKPMTVYNHGTIKLLFGLIKLGKDNLDFARGSIGYKISVGDKTIVNLGDTLLLDEWKDVNPDVLMIPIGGDRIPNTMGVKDALKAVEMIKPDVVIPCHFNVPLGFKKNINPTDYQYFKREVERNGRTCQLMGYGSEIIINGRLLNVS